MTLTVLVQHPLFKEIITNPVLITDEARRCLATAKQYTKKNTNNPLSERFVHALESALQPASPRDALDQTPVEMALLEAWYMKRQDLVSACGMPVTEIVSLW
jgi:hypothetical protein